MDSLNLLAYTCFDPDGNTVEQGMGRTLNVSESGILLETNIEFEEENRMSVTIAIEETLVEISGTIIRSQKNSDNMFESGIQFSEINPQQFKVLKTYIIAFQKSQE